MYQLLTAPAAVSLTRVLAHMERDEVVAQARLAGIKGLVALLQVACGFSLCNPHPQWLTTPSVALLQVASKAESLVMQACTLHWIAVALRGPVERAAFKGGRGGSAGSSNNDGQPLWHVCDGLPRAKPETQASLDQAFKDAIAGVVALLRSCVGAGDGTLGQITLRALNALGVPIRHQDCSLLQSSDVFELLHQVLEGAVKVLNEVTSAAHQGDPDSDSKAASDDAPRAAYRLQWNRWLEKGALKLLHLLVMQVPLPPPQDGCHFSVLNPP